MTDVDHDDAPVDDDEPMGPVTAIHYPIGVETEVPGTNGQLFKTVLVEGKGARFPPSGSQVSVHYVGTLASDGSKFDSSRDRGDHFSFKIGQRQVILGWDKGVATMKKGERSNLRCLPEYAYGKNGSPPKIPADATLNFDVELFDWTSSEDISGGAKTLLKEKITAGTGWDKADYESEVTCDVRIFSLAALGGDGDDAAKADTVEAAADEAAFWVKRDWSFVYGVDTESQDLPAFDKVLKDLVPGERSAITVRASAYPLPSSLGASLPPGDYVYDVAIKHLNVVKTWNYQGQAKLDQARQRKDDANGYFGKKDFVNAEKKYRRALEFLEASDYSYDEEQREACKQMTIACHSNLAQVFLNLKQWDAAVKCCDKAIAIDAAHSKSLFRRAKAFLGQSEFAAAKVDLKRILEIDASNADAHAEMQRAIEGERAYNQQQKARYSKLFA